MKKKTKTYDFFRYLDLFIKASVSGKRRQPNGKRISKGTINNYKNTHKLLHEFHIKEGVELKIVPVNKQNRKEYKKQLNYWKKFYKDFTAFLYKRGVGDNYVGTCLKPIRTFFIYLSKEHNISIGEIYKYFYIPSENIQILTLFPEQMKFLLSDKAIECKLTEYMKLVKDIFVFGCTVGLRFGDLMKIKPSNFQEVNGNLYLRMTSQKTMSQSQIKLPAYAIEIIRKYLKRRRKYLFPKIYLTVFNENLKKIGERAGWTHIVEKSRKIKGEYQTIYKPGTSDHYRFCDLMSSHLMRRTSITNMLILGTDEAIVRKISGHTPGSKDFYRYVDYAQLYVDKQTEKYFEFYEKTALN
jgi:integrase